MTYREREALAHFKAWRSMRRTMVASVKLAREYPRKADYFRSEATRLHEQARWHLHQGLRLTQWMEQRHADYVLN